MGFVLPSAGIVAAIGGFNVAHVDSQRFVKETLAAKPGRCDIPTMLHNSCCC